jgi:hypothetical protein
MSNTAIHPDERDSTQMNNTATIVEYRSEDDQ